MAVGSQVSAIRLLLVALGLACQILPAAPPAGRVVGWGFNGNGEATGTPPQLRPSFILRAANSDS